MAIRPERLLVSSILLNQEKGEIIKSGFNPDNMVVFEEELRYLLNQKKVPGIKTFRARFPEFRVTRVSSDDIPALMDQCRERKVQYDLVDTIKKTARDIKSGRIKHSSIAKKLESNIRKVNNQYSLSADINPLDNIDVFLEKYGQKRKRVRGGGTVGISYGFKTIDKFTGGMLDKELIAVAARTSVGKTFFMCNLAAQAMLDGNIVLYNSLEMPWDQIFGRIITLLAFKHYGSDSILSTKNLLLNSKINLGKIPMAKMKRVLRDIEKKTKGRIIVPEITGNFSIEAAGRKVEQSKADIVFFDYFGLAVGEGGGGKIDNWAQAAEASHAAKKIAMDNDIPFVMGAQLNRGGSQSPQIEHIALTDAIGQDSDKVYMLTPRGKRRLIIDCKKFRGGPSNLKITTSWNVDKGDMQELAFNDMDMD